MRHFKNIIDNLKRTVTRIKNYLTQPLHNNRGEVAGNRITIFYNDIRNSIVNRVYWMCINKLSWIVILHVVTVAKNVYKKANER